ncbi:FliH/SctL family protein [Sphingosinicella terrae]|uniref:FliH/SctL family protein n=1 Tax=Sphingosinicella terrae TaxID=2172047 RepID=UPI000E0CFFD0|nr:FliH/SctL family protein [Sphingosinicella terrae]
MGVAFQVKPFAFDRIFTDAAPGAEAAPRVDRGALESIEAELRRLRSEQEAMIAVARAEAYQEGLQQARRERETAVLAAVDALQASLELIEERFAEVEKKVVREAGELALAAGELLAARELATDDRAAIEAAIGRALAQVRRGEPLTIHVHPDQVEAVEALVAERRSRERRRLSLTVLADASLVQGDARIRWEQGGLLLDAAARRDAVRAELDALLPPV